MPDLEKFRRELTDLINVCSLENLSNTPDYMLADYLIDCLNAYGASVSKRDSWYGTLNPALGAAPGFRIQQDNYTLHVRKEGDGNFTIDLDPQTLLEGGPRQ